MNKLDIIIAIPLIWGLVCGIMKGLIHELTSLLALALGIYGSIKLGGVLENYMKADLSFTSPYTSIVAFCIVFIAILVLVFLTGRLLEKLIKATPLNGINKLAGALLGMLKYALVLGSFFLIIEKAEKNKIHILAGETKENSLLYAPVYSLSEIVFSNVQ